MQFKIESERKVKATLEMGGKTYKFYAPLLAQSEQVADMYDKAEKGEINITKVMKEYLSKLSDMPVEEMDKLETEMFNELFKYVTVPAKKN
jgi:phosphoserine phosphatase